MNMEANRRHIEDLEANIPRRTSTQSMDKSERLANIPRRISTQSMDKSER